jgi:hypothetical protein
MNRRLRHSLADHPARLRYEHPCVHRGAEAIRLPKANRGCRGCPETTFHVFTCAVHGECSMHKFEKKTKACCTCAEYKKKPDETGLVRGDVQPPAADAT